jgi:hypothetical protein
VVFSFDAFLGFPLRQQILVLCDVDRDACTFLRKISADVSVEPRSDRMATNRYRASDWDRMVKIEAIGWQRSDIEQRSGSW